MNEATIEQAVGKLKISGGSMSLADFECWVLDNVFGAQWDNYKAVTGRVIYALEDRRLARVTVENEGFELHLR